MSDNTSTHQFELPAEGELNWDDYLRQNWKDADTITKNIADDGATFSPEYFDGISALSSPPSPSNSTAVYLDDGTNTSSGTPEWRITTDGGSTWNDLV